MHPVHFEHKAATISRGFGGIVVLPAHGWVALSFCQCFSKTTLA